MKVKILLLVLLSLGLLMADNNPKTNSKIVRVKVYNSGCLVEREAVFYTKKGVSTIHLTGFPDFVDKKSVIIKGMSAKDAKVLDYNFYTEDYLDDSFEYDMEKIKLTAKNLESKIAKHTKRIEFFNRLKVGLQKNVEVNYKNATSQDLNDIQEFSINGESYEVEKINLINDSLKLYSEKITKLKQKQKDAVVIPKQTITVNVKSDRAQKNVFSIKYFIKNTGWIPFYNVDVSPDKNKANIKQYASIYQVTGEDWEDVEITISNEIPTAITSIPSLKYLYINPRDFNILGSNQYRQVKSAGKNIKEYVIDPFKTLEERQNFILTGKYSLNSGAPNLKVKYVEKEILAYYTDLIDLTREAKVNYYVSLVNDQPQKIKKGNANLFLNSRFKGKEVLSDLAPDDSVSFILGNSRSVAVIKKVIEESNEENGIFSKEVQRKKEFEYKLKNHGLKTRFIKLVDKIPFARSTSVKVKIKSEGWVHNKESGQVVYRIKLKPKEEITIPLDYEISFPKDEFY